MPNVYGGFIRRMGSGGRDPRNKRDRHSTNGCSLNAPKPTAPKGCPRYGLWQSPRERARLLQAIDHSLRYLRTDKARRDYAAYTAPGQPGAALGPNLHQRVIRSLERFRHLVQTRRSAAELQASVKREFVFYQSIGTDGQGRVDFTGYYAPTYRASLVPTAEYRYPLFRRPPILSSGESRTQPAWNWKGRMVSSGVMAFAGSGTGLFARSPRGLSGSRPRVG